MCEKRVLFAALFAIAALGSVICIVASSADDNANGHYCFDKRFCNEIQKLKVLGTEPRVVERDPTSRSFRGKNIDDAAAELVTKLERIYHFELPQTSRVRVTGIVKRAVDVGGGTIIPPSFDAYVAIYSVYTNSDTVGEVELLSSPDSLKDFPFETQPLEAGTYHLVIKQDDGLDSTNFMHTYGGYELQLQALVDPALPKLPTTLGLHAEPEPTEGGSAVTVEAFLDEPAPVGGTTVIVSLSGTADGEDYTLSSGTITIAEGESEGTVTLTVIDDAVADGGETIVIDAVSKNPALTAATYTLAIEDNDDEGVELSTNTLSVNQGEQGVYTVQLGSRPDDDAMVVVTPEGDNPHVNFDPASVAFSAQTWETPQRITITVDEENQEDVLTITHAVTGYGDVTHDGAMTVNVVRASASDELSYKLCPRDAELIDGDKVHIDVNEERVFEDHELTGRTDDCRTIRLKRNPQRNTITVFAINEGTAEHNTARLTIVHAATEAELAAGDWWLKTGQRQGWEVYAQSEDEVTLRPISGDAEQIVVKDAVTAVAAAAVANVSANIGARFSGSPGGAPALTLAGVRVGGGVENSWLAQGFATRHAGVVDPWQAEGTWGDGWQGRRLSAEDLLGNSSFQVALGVAEGGAEAGALSGWTMWGRGDLLRLESDAGEEGSYDGNILAGYLGLDKRLTDQWTVGLAGSRIAVSAEYALESGEGELDLNLTGVHPYARFASAQGTEVSVILGWGTGKIENVREGAGGQETTDARLLMAGVGGRHNVARGVLGGMDVSLLGDVGYGKMSGDSDEQLETLADLSIHTFRVRSGVEGSYTRQLEAGATLTPFAEVAARYDGGTGDHSSGIEVAGGVTYASPAQGLGLQARASVLALSSRSDYREYGASATFSLTPQGAGQGLSVSVTPRLGRPSGGADALWRHDPFALADRSREPRFGVDARMEYGMAELRFGGRVAPFTELQWLANENRRVRAGVRMGRQAPAGRGLDMQFYGERITRVHADAEERINVLANWRF